MPRRRSARRFRLRVKAFFDHIKSPEESVRGHHRAETQTSEQIPAEHMPERGMRALYPEFLRLFL